MSYSLVPGGAIEKKMAELKDMPASDEVAAYFGAVAKGKSGRTYEYVADSGIVFVFEPKNLQQVAIAPPTNLTPLPLNDITWVGSPHFAAGRSGLAPEAIVLHTMGGSLAGTDSWFNNPNSQVSTHFGIGLDGSVHQYVASVDTAWGNGGLEAGNAWSKTFTDGRNPNYRSISIETEDKGSDKTPVTREQFIAVARLCLFMKQKYPTLKYLATHSSISPSSRPYCPGSRWVPTYFADIAKIVGLKELRP